MFNSELLQKILVPSKMVGQEEFNQAEKESKKKNISLEDSLINNKIISEEALYETAAEYFKIPFIDLKKRIIRRDVIFLIPEPIASAHQIIAFDQEDKNIKIALLDPYDLQTLEFIERKTGLTPEIYLTNPQGIKKILKQYHKGLHVDLEAIKQEERKKKAGQGGELEKLAEELPIIKIVDSLLENAIFEGASDIHIEPEEKTVAVRYRIDGILKKVMTLPKNALSGITARIKVLANLKLDEHRIPQDGRFKIATEEYKVSFRVSVIPVYDGEKVVMRLLTEGGFLSLEQLGFIHKQLEIVKRNIKKPHGMILVTGPTGSGKTTTLYAILNILNQPEVNISTIEDPIEYRMPGVNQSQISPRIGFSFATGLRSLLRQDPNILMVGEIRDKETSEIAIHAALTGHLVLSTLHTNDAVTAIPRLLDMGAQSFLLAGTLNLIIAQRLTRKICANCIQSYNLDKKNIEELGKQFSVKNILKMLETEKIILSREEPLEKMLFYHGRGCSQCSNEGYKGRVGIYETLEITKEMAELILKGSGRLEIEELAKSQGMLTMAEDGFIKAKNGITTLEEVIRVTQE